jgi:hypothetical protein
MIDCRNPLRNPGAAHHPTCPGTPAAMDINAINSKVTASNQVESFMGPSETTDARAQDRDGSAACVST